MIFDLIFLGIIFLFFIIGYLKGAVNQLLTLSGIFLAYYFSQDLSNLILRNISLNENIFVISQLLKIVSAIIIYVLAKLSAIILEFTILKGNIIINKGNRLIGGGIGLFKGILLGFVFLLSIAFMVKGNIQFINKYKTETEKSISLKMVFELDLLKKVEFISMLTRVNKEISGKLKNNTEMKDPMIKKIMDNPKLKKLMKEKSSIEKINSAEMDDIFKDPKISEVLKDYVKH